MAAGPALSPRLSARGHWRPCFVCDVGWILPKSAIVGERDCRATCSWAAIGEKNSYDKAWTLSAASTRVDDFTDRRAASDRGSPSLIVAVDGRRAFSRLVVPPGVLLVFALLLFGIVGFAFFGRRGFLGGPLRFMPIVRFAFGRYMFLLNDPSTDGR
jgi:hypothetical protein